MKSILIGASAALLVASASAGVAQSVQAPAISALRCGDITKADPAYQAALVYYAAGYRDGADYAMALNNSVGTQASSAISAMASGPVASIPDIASEAVSNASSQAPSSSASAESGAAGSTASTPILGGLTLQAQVVIDACKQSPEALVTDIIANRGGGAGFKGTPGGTATPTTGAGSTSLPAPTGTTGASNPAAAAGTASGAAANTVASGLQGASQQLQQSISSGTPPAGGASAPAAAGTAPPATGASSP